MGSKEFVTFTVRLRRALRNRRCIAVFIALPDAVLHAIRQLNDAGYEAYTVGGCVRDSLMGCTPEDWDITTSATPDEMQTVFRDYRCIATGLRHGTLTVMVEDVPLEITTYRVDGDYSDGRHPDAVIFTRSLAEDLCRRDFTINAMAYHPVLGLVDFYGGQEDIMNGVIRCVGDAKRRFCEDALRILRALRFASVLGFTIDADTATALTTLSPTLCCVSVERIAVEFKKLLCGKNVASVLQTYRYTVTVFLPEISLCEDFEAVVRTRAVPSVRLAMVFHCAHITAQEAETTLRRLRFDNRTIHEASLLLTKSSKAVSTQRSYLLYLLNRLGPELIYDYLSIHGADEHTMMCAAQLLEERACYRISMLAVTGNDVITAGVEAGPEVGRVLQALLNAVMDGICPNRKEDLLDYIAKTEKPVQ